MPRNNDGTFTYANSSVNPAVPLTTISSSDFNSQVQDTADALTDSLSRSGLGEMQANLKMGGYKVTGLGQGSASGEAVSFEQLGNLAFVNATTLGQALVTAPDAATARAAIGAVNIAGDTMTGALTVRDTLSVSANVGANSHVRLRDDAGVVRATLYWDRNLGQSWWMLHDNAGAVQNSVRLTPTSLTVAGSAVWTDANKAIGSNQILANLTGSTAAPTGNSLSAILDTLNNMQGSIAYRGASGWTALAPGSVGQVLTTFGSGGNPAWTTFTASVSDPWTAMPIGVPIAVFDHIPGVLAPPTDQAYRYVKLTAGETGSGQYNQGILTNETVTGTAPLVSATAQISLGDSPLNGQTIRLINTERRFVRAGSAGTIQDDALQGHRHPPLSGTSFMARNGGSNFSGGGASMADPATTGDPSSDGTNGTPRTANETRARNIGATYYMRIR